VSNLVRVYVAEASADERRALRDRVSRVAGWSIVDRPEDADIVVMNAAAFAHLPATRAPVTAPADRIVETLTARELDVLRLLADGIPNREIARALGISEHTVKFHLAAVFGKLGASTRTDAVRRALQLGLIEI
jgi:DNA-binding CsgD family transcriptional regulator